jgi:putative intracellular protease/amidase
MKKIAIFLAVVILVGTSVISLESQVYGQSDRKVLMIIREGRSSDPDLMIKMEVGTMNVLLKKAGFGVVIASLSGQDVSGPTQKIEKLLKLSEIKLEDYVGVIIPCMGVPEAIASPEMVTTVKDILAKDKLVAASNGGVTVLAKAGLLKGKKYAFYTGPADSGFGHYFDITDLEGATYSGQGVVQDGKIITGGGCPSSEANRGIQNRTLELTQTFIAAIGSK